MGFQNRRRSRGKAFENSIVKFFQNFNDVEGDSWYARNLGGSSMGWPDVVVTNNHRGIIFSIEAKSTFQGESYIPADQVQRCFDVLKMFGTYKKPYVVFAFKFSKNENKGRDKLRYYFFKVKISNIENIKWVKCFYDGTLRYKLLDPEKKTLFKIIRYPSLLHLKENVIIKPLTELMK